MAFRRGPGAKLPTVRELCHSLNTSTRTLDEALHRLEEQRIVYRKRGSGIYVSPRINRKLVVMLLGAGFFSTPSPFWGLLWALLVQKAQSRLEHRDEDTTFQLVMPDQDVNTTNGEVLQRILQEHRVSSIIGIGLDSEVTGRLAGLGLPYVGYACYAPHVVMTQTAEAQAQAIEFLVRLGCHRIGCVRQYDSHAGATHDEDDSVASFRDCLEAAGGTFDERYVVDFRRIRDAGPALDAFMDYQKQGYDSILRLFKADVGPPPDGLVISSDMVTDGALAAMSELGIALWDDIKVATPVNVGSPILANYTHRLISMEGDPQRIVDSMYELLDAVMSGKPADESVILQYALRLPPSAIETLNDTMQAK